MSSAPTLALPSESSKIGYLKLAAKKTTKLVDVKCTKCSGDEKNVF